MPATISSAAALALKWLLTSGLRILLITALAFVAFRFLRLLTDRLRSVLQGVTPSIERQKLQSFLVSAPGIRLPEHSERDYSRKMESSVPRRAPSQRVNSRPNNPAMMAILKPEMAMMCAVPVLL